MNSRRAAFLTMAAAVVLAARVAGQQGSTAGGDTKGAKHLDGKAIGRLIEQLRSTDAAVREQATRELSGLDEAPEALRAAAKSDDLEMRRRAQAALERITQRLEEKAFKALLADLHRVELDRFVRRMVRDEKFQGANQWKTIAATVKAVTKRASELGAGRFAVPDFELFPVADLGRERIAFVGKRLLLSNSEPRVASWDNCVILCAGPTPRTTSLSNSILIVDGDFTGATGIDNSLLIVRGNVGRVTSVRRSIILATGNFVGATGCDDSFVQVNNQRIRFTGARNSIFVNTALKTTGPTNSRSVETDRGPLQLLRFSARKPDAKLAWGPEVKGLAVAITRADEDDKFLIRWKNVGDDFLELPWNRFRSDTANPNADDLLGHIVLKTPDGKLAPAREYPPVGMGRPRGLGTAVVLGPGQVHEEVIDLWAYVKKPEADGEHQLSIKLDISEARRRDFEARLWTGAIESNVLTIKLNKGR